jgi:cysteinyl-tRNA synthetase
MSKRHGNIIYSSTFIENYGINVLKFLILNCSHSKPLTVTVEKVNEIQQIINKYFSLLRKVNFFLVLGKFSFLGKKENKKEITNYCEILRNGLNFPKYFKRLQSMFKKLNYLMITVDIFNFKSVFSKNIDEIVTYFFHFRRMFWFLGIEFKVYYHFKKKHEKIIND